MRINYCFFAALTVLVILWIGISYGMQYVLSVIKQTLPF